MSLEDVSMMESEIYLPGVSSEARKLRSSEDLALTNFTVDYSLDNVSYYQNWLNATAPDDSFNGIGNVTVPVLFSPFVIWAWTIMLVILLVVGLIGNCLVIAVVARTRDLRSSTNILLVNLAGADLLVLLVPLPTALTELHSKPETWVLGKAMCKAVPFVEWTVSHASVLTILVIGSERYYAICRPLRASYTCTRLRALVCISCIWVGAVLVSMPIVLLSQYQLVKYIGQSTLVPACYTAMHEDHWGRYYYTGMVVLLFFLPLSLLLVLYALIARRLMRESTSVVKDHNKPDPPNIRARKQVVVMLASVTLVFFSCLLPFRVFSLFTIWDEGSGKWMGPTKYYNILYGTRLLLYLNSSVNPILYNLTSTKFRDAFIKIVNRDGVSGGRGGIGGGGGIGGISRQSTLTTTGNSYSTSRSGSSRFEPTLGVGRLPNDTSRGQSLAKYGRQWSLDALPTNIRKPLIHCGRPSSFTASHLCEWNNGKTSSVIGQGTDGGGPTDGKMSFVVKEENNKFRSSFKDLTLQSVKEQSSLSESPPGSESREISPILSDNPEIDN